MVSLSLFKFGALSFMFSVVCAADVPGRLVNEQCLSCICQAATECKHNSECNGGSCGLFAITLPYWLDAGEPKVPGEPDSSSDKTAYQNCTLDPHCATLTVQGYMKKFAQDCNGDGKVNCYDYIAIHRLGGYGCTGELPSENAKLFNQCMGSPVALI